MSIDFSNRFVFAAILVPACILAGFGGVKIAQGAEALERRPQPEPSDVQSYRIEVPFRNASMVVTEFTPQSNPDMSCVHVQSGVRAQLSCFPKAAP